MALSNAQSGRFSMLSRQPLTRLEQINRDEEPTVGTPFDFSPEKIKAAVARDTALLSGTHQPQSELVRNA